MITPKPFIVVFLFVITSCSNLLTWHLDKGIHKQAKIDANQSPSVQVDDNEVIVKVDISANIVWSKSINSGLEGNSGYLYPVKNNKTIYGTTTPEEREAAQITEDELNTYAIKSSNLENIFNEIDSDNDGEINRDELTTNHFYNYFDCVLYFDY